MKELKTVPRVVTRQNLKGLLKKADALIGGSMDLSVPVEGDRNTYTALRSQCKKNFPHLQVSTHDGEIYVSLRKT